MNFFSLSNILNLTEKEWPRVIIAWTIRFLFHTGFIIGWTTLLAMFVTRIGVEYLPFLLMTNAALMILGTMLYSELIHRVNKEQLLVITTLFAGITLYCATFFPYYSNIIFFGFILIAGAILLSQLNIIISIFIEELFSPLESQRTFPIIESAETIGGIIGGTILSILARFVLPYKFLFIWIILTLLIIPLIFSFRRYAKKLPYLEFEKIKKEKKSSIEKIATGYKHIKNIPFLKGLVFVVLLQWIFVNLLEFQYITAIQKNLINQQNYESALTVKLGYLHIIFSGSALIVQLFAASRIMNALGIIGSMILQPLVMLFQLTGLTLKFNDTRAIISKASFQITNIMYQNSYHASYYNLNAEIRESAKEFLEGFIKPLGAMIGMGSLIALERAYQGEKLSFSINVIMMILTVALLALLLSLRDKYSAEAKKLLSSKENYYEKCNAIEILSQKGHFDSGKTLAESLEKTQKNDTLQIKILRALGRIQDTKTIPEILDCLMSKNEQVKVTTLETLGQFKDLGKHVFSQAFAKYRVIETLKKMFQEEKSEELRSHIIHVLARLNQSEVADFIIDTLKNTKNENIQADCIEACGLFHDPNAAYYIKNYLQSPNPKIIASVIIALWQFPKYRESLEEKLKNLIENKEEKNLIAAFHATGELKLEKYTPILKKYLHAQNEEIKDNAIISLAKIGHEKALKPITEMLFRMAQKNIHIKNTILKQVPNSLRHMIENHIHVRASEEINNILNESKKKHLSELKKDSLEKLKTIYEFVDEHEEVLKIHQLLNQIS
ncbi:HEAT repeat domain-containing protein [Candidatus Peregrinibacteria bacterium]|nr:HEAT repeat domain-containing protein [Candidatus Peregrinibacteria bacterium]